MKVLMLNQQQAKHYERDIVVLYSLIFLDVSYRHNIMQRAVFNLLNAEMKKDSFFATLVKLSQFTSDPLEFLQTLSIWLLQFHKTDIE